MSAFRVISQTLAIDILAHLCQILPTSSHNDSAMSDPISVAGTAVGITSLGIQVCQALVRYYVQFRSYHDDIDALVQRVEHLENILRALDTVKKKVELDNDEVSQKLQLATKACKEALGSLERTVKKFTEIKLPDAWEDRLRLVKKRLLWPFKKDALMNTQDILDKLQANLLLALQILGIDVENRHFESISSSTNALAQQSDRIETQLNIQAQVLQSIHGNFHTSSSSQRDQLSNLTSHMTNLSSQSAQLCLQMDKVVQRLELVTCDDGSPQDPSQLAPSLLANIIDTSRDLNPAFRRTLRKYKKSIHKMGQLTSSVVSSCTCHLFTRTRERRTIGLYFSKVSRQTFDHLITCPYFPHANFSHTVEAQFNHCAQLLGFCVRAGFVHARQAGWRTVYPTLRFRTVVSYYSPIFTPFERANHWIRAYELWQRANLGYQPMSAEQIETLPGFILSEVTHNLGNRARPSDKLPDGDTVLHKACLFVGDLINFGFFDVESACIFLGSLITTGVPCNELLNDRGRSPLEYLLFRACEERRSIYISVCAYLIRRAGTWCIDDPVPNQIWYDIAAELLSVEELRDAFECSSPIVSAILQRSESDLFSLLAPWRSSSANTTPANDSKEGADHTLILHAISWPRGLAMILSVGVKCIDLSLASNYLHSVDWALRCYNADSLRLLLQVRYPTTPSLWNANLLYLHPDLTDILAKSLWDAGFHSVNIEAESRLSSETRSQHETPLWAHSKGHILYSHSKFPILKWLVNKGARLDWTHPDFCTTPAHMIVRGAVSEAYDPSFRDCTINRLLKNRFFLGVLASPIRDRCSCLCSESGCRVLPSAIQKINDTHTLPMQISEDEHLHNRMSTLVAITKLVESLREDSPWMCESVIRVLTFEELGLTHTCCYRVDDEIEGSYTRPSEEEIHEIHYAESKDIDLFHHLMGEFTEKLRNYDGTFDGFYHLEWTPRMKEILLEGSTVDDAQIESILAIGVRPYGPHQCSMREDSSISADFDSIPIPYMSISTLVNSPLKSNRKSC